MWRLLSLLIWFGSGIPGTSDDAEKVRIPKRFPVPVRSTMRIDTGTVHSGDTLYFAIAQDLRQGECVLFREGTPVKAMVTEARQPGVLGRPSLLIIEILGTNASDGTRVGLAGSIRAEGEDRTMESVGSAAGVCCLGLFIPGGKKAAGKGIGTLALTQQDILISCPDQH